jgi:glycyl-tRNA synthetase alpha subunit
MDRFSLVAWSFPWSNAGMRVTPLERPSATKSRSAPDKIIWVHQLWNVLRPRCDNRADIYGHFTFVTLELVELMAL